MSAPIKRHGIVVAVDGSPESTAAVKWATGEAAMRNIPLTVVHAVVTPMATWPPMPYTDWLATQLEDEGKKAVLHAVKIAEEAMPADRRVTINRELVHSAPGLALIEFSDEAEMVVVGSAGRGLLARSVLGSVSSNVVRHARCPVAVIRDEDQSDVAHAPVLVGVDGSPASERATAIAFDQASRRGVELMALHAWSDVEVDPSGVDWSSVQAESERSLAESLATWAQRYPDVGVQRIVVCDRPARQLVEKSESAQLVVVGSNGRGGLTGMLGSVSHAVVNSVRRPVIVVPAVD